MNVNPKNIVLAMLVVFICGCSTQKTQTGTNSSVDISTMKSLAGYWQSVPTSSEPQETVLYKVTSGGTAVEETLFPGTSHEMVSVYFQEGPDLVMTHYCMLGNQPKLQATRTGPKDIQFRYIGGTNINPSRDDHMNEMHLTLIDENHIRQEWSGLKNGQKGETKIIELVRQNRG